jgi:hypothetical protein
MDKVAKILFNEFTLLKLDLIKKYNDKGMRASGNWEQSLELNQNNLSIKLLGESYSQQLESGRQAGKQPPSKVIEQWIIDKGISNKIQGKISISSLAFLIARKIGREGWKRQGYGGVDLISEVITDKRIQEIINKVGEQVVATYVTEIIREFDNLQLA